MGYGNLQFGITREQLDEMLQKVEELSALLEHTIVLSKRDKQRGLQLGIKTDAFLRRSLECGENCPQFVPTHVSLEDLAEDYDTATKLGSVALMMKGVLIRVEDTRKALLIEGVKAGMSIYRQALAQYPDGVEGAQAVIENLKGFMPRTGKGKAKKSSSPSTEGT